MPCWEINTVAIDFDVKSREMLIKSLLALNLSYWVDGNVIRINDRVTLDLERKTAQVISFDLLNQIKRKYTELNWEEVAKKKRMVLKKLGNNKYQLIKY